MTSSATEVTAHALTAAELAEVGVALEAGGVVAATMTPPTTPPATSATPAAAHGSHRRELRACLEWLMIGSYFMPARPPATTGHVARLVVVSAEYNQHKPQPASPALG
jgi:hypothetical protein